MKVKVIAKIVGNNLPKKQFLINNCCIRYRPKDPLTRKRTDKSRKIDSSFSNFQRRQGKSRNWVFSPSEKFSPRDVVSDYLIETIIEERFLNSAYKVASNRFLEVVSSLGLSVRFRKRTNMQWFGYEIIEMYYKEDGGKWRITELPKIEMKGHNYFPKTLSLKHERESLSFLQCTDQTFKKGFEYLSSGMSQFETGFFSKNESFFNLFKVIELISNQVGIKRTRDRKTKKMRSSNMTEKIRSTGKKLRIHSQYIAWATRAYRIRNKADFAHAINLYEGLYADSFLYWPHLKIASEIYLLKYYKSLPSYLK